MGSSLLLWSLDWKVEKDKKGKREVPIKGFLRVCEKMDKKIDKLKKLPGRNDIEDISGGAWGYKSDGVAVDEDGNLVDLAGYKQYLHALVNDVREGWENRDTCWFMVGGHHWVFVTGGESWGDEPSETYSTLAKLYQAGVV